MFPLKSVLPWLALKKDISNEYCNLVWLPKIRIIILVVRNLLINQKKPYKLSFNDILSWLYKYNDSDISIRFFRCNAINHNVPCIIVKCTLAKQLSCTVFDLFFVWDHDKLLIAYNRILVLTYYTKKQIYLIINH